MEDDNVVQLKRRTTEERENYLMMRIGMLVAEVEQLKKQVKHLEEFAITYPVPQVSVDPL